MNNPLRIGILLDSFDVDAWEYSAIEQIANRLRYVIPGTAISRPDKTGTATPLTSVTADNDRVLQWVAYDGDSFEAITSDSNR